MRYIPALITAILLSFSYTHTTNAQYPVNIPDCGNGFAIIVFSANQNYNLITPANMEIRTAFNPDVIYVPTGTNAELPLPSTLYVATINFQTHHGSMPLSSIDYSIDVGTFSYPIFQSNSPQGSLDFTVQETASSVFYNNTNGGGQFFQFMEITVCEPVQIQLVKPVSSLNEFYAPTEVNDGFLSDETALAYSQIEGQPVHAAANGVVTVINDLRPDLADDPGEYCDFNINSTPPHCDVDIPTTMGEHSWRNAEFEVIIDTDVGLFTYLVDNAPAYVDPGTPVTAGCVLGETIELVTWAGFNLTQGGAAVQWFDDGNGNDPGPLVPLLTVEPTTTEPCRPAPEIQYVHPIARADRLPNPETNNPFLTEVTSETATRDMTVGAWSTQMGANVHAPANGVVQRVEAIGNDIDGADPFFVLEYGVLLARDWCEQWVGTREGRTYDPLGNVFLPDVPMTVWDCVIYVGAYDETVAPGVFRGDGGDIPVDLGVGAGGVGVGIGLGNDSPILYVVTLSLDDGATMTYLVANAPNFVEPGGSVVTGCIIGQTYGLNQYQPLQQIDWFSGDPDYGGAIVYKTIDGNKERVVDQFLIDPDLPTRCNVPDEYERCIGDYTMTNATAWNVESPWYSSEAGANFTSTGVTLSPETRISAVYNLDPAREPQIVFYARSLSGPGRLEVTLGNTIETFDIATGDFQEYTLPAAAHVADLDPFYTYSYENISGQLGSAIEISSACLSFTKDENGDDETGGDGTLENPCAFDDNSFNAHNNDSWITTAGVEKIDAGALNVPDGETIGQNITVPSGDYTLTVVTELWTTPDYTPDYTDTISSIGLTYNFTTTGGGVSGGEFEPLSTFNGALGQYTYEIEITLTAPMEAAAADITAQLITSNPDILGLKITFICFSGESLIFGVDCGAGVPRPNSPTQIGAWVNYLWNQQNIFFRCELMIFLNTMYETLLEFFETIGYAIRWGFASVDQFWSWSQRVFFPWLDGHFRNIAEGRQTFIEINEGGEQCNNLFCVITGLFGSVDSIIGNVTGAFETVLVEVFGPVIDAILELLSLTVGFAFDLGGSLIDGFLWLLNRVFDLFGTARDLLGALVDAWNNSEPTPIDGAPDCSNPQSNALCAGLWMAENTVFSGPGAAIIPILIAYSAIMLLLWSIGTLRNTVMQSGRGI